MSSNSSDKRSLEDYAPLALVGLGIATVAITWPLQTAIVAADAAALTAIKWANRKGEEKSKS